VLIRCPIVITIELHEVRHPEPMQVWNHVEVFCIGFLVNLGTPFWCEAKLPKSPSDLVPHTLDHSPTNIVPHQWSVRCWRPRKEYIMHGSIWYTVTYWGNVRPVGHRMVEWLLHFEVHPWTRLTDVGEYTLIPLTGGRHRVWCRGKALYTLLLSLPVDLLHQRPNLPRQ
jgi:hypothetical protein